jgi:hypothetical protein
MALYKLSNWRKINLSGSYSNYIGCKATIGFYYSGTGTLIKNKEIVVAENSNYFREFEVAYLSLCIIYSSAGLTTHFIIVL